MKYLDAIKQNAALKESIFEIPASFLFVVLYSFLMNSVPKLDDSIQWITGVVFFAALYFFTIRFFFSAAEVHIIPVVSFIESLRREDISIFLYRLPGQLLGGAMAIFVIWAFMGIESGSLYSLHLLKLDPFLTGLFTGFISQLIYLIHYFFIVRLRSVSLLFRFFLFSIGLGFVFFLLTQLGKITLLNPFGFLFLWLLSGDVPSIQLVLIGLVIHILVPIFFIAGTHFFMKTLTARLDID